VLHGVLSKGGNDEYVVVDSHDQRELVPFQVLAVHTPTIVFGLMRAGHGVEQGVPDVLHGHAALAHPLSAMLLLDLPSSSPNEAFDLLKGFARRHFGSLGQLEKISSRTSWQILPRGLGYPAKRCDFDERALGALPDDVAGLGDDDQPVAIDRQCLHTRVRRRGGVRQR
jgi:hypothetical protein